MFDKIVVELSDIGFFIMGDLGVFSDDGYFLIVGCFKDLIIMGGYNVYFKEIEDVLNEIDGVLESVVFGVFDVDFGEVIVVVIVFILLDEVDIKEFVGVVV